MTFDVGLGGGRADRTKIQLWFTEMECADRSVSDLLIVKNNKPWPSPLPNCSRTLLPARAWSS